MRTTLFLFAIVLSSVEGLKADLILNPTFVDAQGQTWDSDKLGVVNQAIADWQGVFSGVNGITRTIDFDVTFTQAGNTYLGQMALGFSGFGNILPWSTGTSAVLSFNADYFDGTNGIVNQLWFDPTPTTSVDQPFEDWDAISVARHEIGHLLGFNSFYTVGGTSPWASLITANQFEPGGLNVVMTTGDAAHLAQSLNMLMSPALVNGVRQNISSTEAQMLSHAYGYDLVAVPEPASLLVFGSLQPLALLRRRRVA